VVVETVDVVVDVFRSAGGDPSHEHAASTTAVRTATNSAAGGWLPLRTLPVPRSVQV
jgi:hypothetical protein